MGGRSRGFLVAGLCVAALTSVPVAEASEGGDYTEPWIGPSRYVNYQADPGEANNLLVEPWYFGGGLHLKDTGAIIRWTYAPERSNCVGGVHDVWCTNGTDVHLVIVLGNRRDTFVNRSAAPAWVDARDGEADRITCGAAPQSDDVIADALDVIVNPGSCNSVERG